MSSDDNLGPGNSKYVYSRDPIPNLINETLFSYVVITGNSGSTASGSTASSTTGNSYATRTGESANSETGIWTYDPATQDIRVVWTNTDGGSVPTKLVYFKEIEPAAGDISKFPCFPI